MIKKNISFKKESFFLIALCLLLTMFFSVPAVQAQYVRYKNAFGKRYVYLRDVARYYGMSLAVGTKTCELRSRYSQIIFTYQKRSGYINGVKVTFLNAPFLKGREPFISEHDFILFLDPILRKAALQKGRIKTVMIDPGHGKQDTGAIGSRYKEKDLVLQIAKKLKSRLQQKGYRVLMTRTSDTFPSLSRRTELCNKFKPDIFISIHCNSAASKTASGIETYCMTPAGEASSSSVKPEQASQNGNRHDKENARLAYAIQKNILRKTRANDRGVKFARFFVLKNITCPGVLIETGFISNRKEEALLGTAAYQQKIADGIAAGVAAYAEAVK